jgi:DNA-binding CsgD family transcriptional regulator
VADGSERRAPLSGASAGEPLHSPAALGAELERLLRQLIDQFARGSPVTSDDLPVLVATEVDGARYVVLVAKHAIPHNVLSPREHEIARMVAHGLPNKTIAANLGISSWTVSTHLRRMSAKLGVNSRVALVTKVFEEELTFDAQHVLPL